MKKAGAIHVIHIVLLAMTFIGLKNHVTIIPAILGEAGRDGWMSVLLGAIVILPWIWLVIFITKKLNGEPLPSWLRRKIGRIPSALILYPFAVFLFILAALTMRETLLWVGSTFLPKTPMLIILTLYTILCVVLITTTLKSISMINVIVLFGVVILGFFVAIVNIQVKDYELLRPYLEHGFTRVATGMVYPASGYLELSLLLFLQHYTTSRLRWYHYLFMLFLLTGLTAGPLIGAIVEFGPVEAASQRYPAYEEWGLATIGRFFEHMDFLSIYQWMTGGFIRIGILLFIIVEIFRLTGKKQEIWTKIAPPFFILCLVLVLVSDYYFLKLNNDWILIFTFCYFALFIIILAIIAALPERSTKEAARNA